MMKTIKKYFMAFMVGISTALGSVLMLIAIFGKAEVENTLNEDELLADEGHSIDNKINGLESELDIPPDDLTDQQIEDYWN